MYAVCVTTWVKPGKEKDFIRAVLENAAKTRQEPENVRFDVLQAEGKSNQFFLYEVYRSPEGFKSHQQTQHYLKWKAAVADWMEQPRQGVRHFSLFPADADW